MTPCWCWFLVGFCCLFALVALCAGSKGCNPLQWDLIVALSDVLGYYYFSEFADADR